MSTSPAESRFHLAAPLRRYGVSDFEDALEGLRGFSELLNLAADSQGAPDPLRLYQLLNPLLHKMDQVFEDMKRDPMGNLHTAIALTEKTS